VSVARFTGLCFHSAFAGISLPNAGSIGLHEAMGFSPVGIYPNVGFKHGKWHFMGWWGLEIRRSHERPTEPLPLLSIDIAPYLVR
jgi:phosphinothricin acetyltransferase